MQCELLLEPHSDAVHQLPPSTVLIVEDNGVLADTLSRQLQQQGFATLRAGWAAKHDRWPGPPART